MSPVPLPPSAFRLVIMGTGPFAVPTFRALLQSQHSILGLATRPDRPTHSREKASSNPMRAVAEEAQLEVFAPESINSAEAHAWLRDQAADLFVVCDYGQILSRETLALSRLGGINLHASLLPKYRGAAPINWAIYNGETETGVTVIHMTPQLDAGPCLVQRCSPIAPMKRRRNWKRDWRSWASTQCWTRLRFWPPALPARALCRIKQQPLKRRGSKKKTAESIGRAPQRKFTTKSCAFQPWPKSYTFLKHEGSPKMRLILESALLLDAETASSIDVSRHAPGEIISAQGDNLIVCCGQGALRILSLQPSGKRLMSTAEFLRGYPLHTGESFEPINDPHHP